MPGLTVSLLNTVDRNGIIGPLFKASDGGADGEVMHGGMEVTFGVEREHDGAQHCACFKVARK